MTVCESMFSRVLEIPPATQTEAQTFFANKLRCETDASDVYVDMQNQKEDFVLVDVRSTEDFQKAHAQGAIHICHRDMTKERLVAFPDDQIFVVYCWGPGCNGSTKAALKLSQQGFAVKEMIGGFEYWEKEGYPIERA